MTDGMNIREKRQTSVSMQQTASQAQNQNEEDIAVFNRNNKSTVYSFTDGENSLFSRADYLNQDNLSIEMGKRKKTKDKTSNTPTPEQIAQANEKIALKIYSRLVD